MHFWTERKYHLFFRISVVLKAVDSVTQICIGLFLSMVSTVTVNKIILALIGNELMETPRDLVFTYLLPGQTQYTISPATQSVWAFILLGHGIIKIFLVAGLLKERLWAYPISAAAFALFAAFQIRESLLAPSIFLNILTVLDFILIGLIIHEYRYRKRRLRSAASGRV